MEKFSQKDLAGFKKQVVGEQFKKKKFKKLVSFWGGFLFSFYSFAFWLQMSLQWSLPWCWGIHNLCPLNGFSGV